MVEQLRVIDGGADGEDVVVRSELPDRYVPQPGFRGGSYDDHVTAARMVMGNIQRDIWAFRTTEDSP
jgi:hypothetical protein